MKQAALTAIRKKMIPEGLESLNESSPEPPETDAVIAAAETLPFMADRRLILLRDHPALIGRAEADERLISYLPSAPASALILFYCVQKPDGRKKLYQAVKKLGGIVSFDPLKGAELTSFVIKEFRKLGKECDQQTADNLIFISGSNANKLMTEINKISAFHPENPSVDPKDVKTMASPTAETSVFRMVEAVVAGQESKAFQLMQDTLRSGEDRVFLLAMLLRQFRLMQHVKIMQYEKINQEKIHALLGVPSFAAQQYIHQAAAWRPRQVRDAVQLCLDTEYAVKTGRMQQEGSLESVMLKLFVIKNETK